MAPPLPTDSLSEPALEAQRAALRRGLARANTAAAVILLIVIGLALAAVWQAAKARRHAVEAGLHATRANRSAVDATVATQRAEEELRRAQFAQARAARTSGVMGRRAESLATLRAAAAEGATLELRNEAIAALALIDLRELWFQRHDLENAAPFAFDPAFAHYATCGTLGEITVQRVGDGAVAATLRSPIRRVLRVGFSPDGQFLTASFATGRRMVWDWRQSNAVIDVKFAQGDLPHTVVFSRLVDPRSGHELATLTAPLPQNIAGLAFNRDGDFLAARAEGREIHVWNLREIRRQLAGMNLDFRPGGEGSGVPVSSVPSLSPGHRPHAPSPPGPSVAWPVALPLSGAVLALGFGVYTFRYQRRLVRSYDEVERLVAERNRALQQAQADLWHSQKMKALGTLAAGIAHDFNNLLSVIRLANDFLKRGVTGQSDLVEETDAIERAVQQGKTVVESMLGYSRSQSDAPQAVRVPDVVEETLGLLSQQFLSGTRLTMELDRETPPVVLSRGRLVQILLNLIVNAAEAMNGAGQLAITVRTAAALPKSGLVLWPREAPAYVELTVADSGPGIPPDVLPRIFEPFFTTKNMDATRGTGLGLSMIYTAAQADGLGLAVETVIGRGTVFRVVIPQQGASVTSRLTPGT